MIGQDVKLSLDPDRAPAEEGCTGLAEKAPIPGKEVRILCSAKGPVQNDIIAIKPFLSKDVPQGVNAV